MIYETMIYKYLLIFTLFVLPLQMWAHDGDVWLHPNRGQWENEILYEVRLSNGAFFVEKDKFTFALNNGSEVYHPSHEYTQENTSTIQYHTIQNHFINSSWGGKVVEKDTSHFYQNYFLGKNARDWKSKIHSFKTIELLEFYPDIDLILETSSTAIKYSFRVHPGADPSIIQMKYEGMDRLELGENELWIHTRFGAIQETNLKVWNVGKQKNQLVKTNYVLHHDTVEFDFPNGYNENEELIIDPDLVFSTFTGAGSDNWGFTACPDNSGNLIAGGIVFGSNYPTSIGAYDSEWHGGDGALNGLKIDIGLSKFSSDGSELMYSTFLGGGGNETPNSIIVDSQDNLYMLGISSSHDFPTSTNAYQTVNKGGTNTNQIAISFYGTDIVVSKLSADGTNLMASTYLGGEANDGLNSSDLNYNYGDVFRGEIILDEEENVLFTSSTKSADFPIVNGENSSLGGGQDAVVVKMNNDLSSIIWSTYLGGNGDDAGFSLSLSDENTIYVTGGTLSTDLPFSEGYTSSFQGGIGDGYIVEMDGNTSQIINGTYVGTSSYDQSFFVDLDQSGNVYVFGQTLGNMTVSSGTYSKANSGQFIQQYSSDLKTLNWSTIVGGGNGTVEISPTAFMVTDCDEIYYTGWGGSVNQNNSQATGSTSFGFPATSDAFESSTNGNNFYIGVLSKNAEELVYGSFMGGVNSSFNHVDGGTSRFDKNGSIYHAVCGACGGNSNGFTTTPGAFSETNNSSNCNMAAWKFDLQAVHAAVSTPDPYVCLPNSVSFTNESENADHYFWDFGDGNTSTSFEPTHTYQSAGTYVVSLIVSDANGCVTPDTSYVTIQIGDYDGAVTQPDEPVCPGSPFQLEASGGSNYQWSPAEFLDDSTAATPTAIVDETTEFTVIVSDSCGIDTLSIVLEVFGTEGSVIEDQLICKGDTVNIWADGGVKYLWTSEQGGILGSNTDASIDVAPEENSEFTVEIHTEEGCDLVGTVFVEVVPDVPQPIVPGTQYVCKGESVNVLVSGAPEISWSPNEHISSTEGENVTISPVESQWYYIDFTNVCGTVRDSIYIQVVHVNPLAGNDTIVCPYQPVNLWADGGESYQWYPAEEIDNPYQANVTAFPSSTTDFTVVVTDEYGCQDSTSVFVEVHPPPSVHTYPKDFYVFQGDEVELNAAGNSSIGSYSWSPTEYLSCVNCKNPTANPPSEMVYTVTFVDENGCEATDETTIYFDPLIYVPNTFTPDGNEFNDFFFAKGGNIDEFQLQIFNRWGELVFESYDMEEGWDGTYDNKPCPDGTYVWKIRYTNLKGSPETLVGHVNVLR